MSHTPQNLYGSMNNAADTYYGTLFSHLSYGMGENSGNNPSGTPIPEAAMAAAAAAAAAVASGRNDWSNPNGYMTGSSILPTVGTHPSMTAGTGTNARDLSCVVPSTALASPYTATLLAAVAAAAAAAYPLPTAPTNTVPPSGRAYLPSATVNNRPEFAPVYYGSPPRPPTASSGAQLGGLVGGLPNWPYTVSATQYPPNTALIGRNGGTIVPFDGWSASAGQQLNLPTACDEGDVVGPYSQGTNDDSLMQKEANPQTYYAPTNLRDGSFGSTLSYSQHQVHSENQNVYPNSKVNQTYTLNRNQPQLLNGYPNNLNPAMFENFVPLNQHQKQPELQPQIVSEFEQLTLRSNADPANNTDRLAASQVPVPVFEHSVSENSHHTRPPVSEAVQWSKRNDNGVFTERSSLENKSKGSSSRPSASSNLFSSNNCTSNSSGNRSAQVPFTSNNNSSRAKTWANIAGQPPKGSAAVVLSAGWSTKRLGGHSMSLNTSQAPTNATGTYSTVQASSISLATGKNGQLNHSERDNGGERQTTFRRTAESANDRKKSVTSNGCHSIGPPTSTTVMSDDSSQSLQRESEALYQRLSKIINPTNFDTHVEKARFFVIKSFSEDDIHRSIKYSIWCSTELGNKKLDSAFVDADHAFPIYLFFSVNGSGHFCGMAEMTSRVDYNARVSVWAQDKWQGKFSVRWIFVKDVPNTALRHIRVETNENKPVTHSRDTTELPLERGRQVMEVFALYSHTLSIFDDFLYYEQRERQEGFRRKDFGSRRG